MALKKALYYGAVAVAILIGVSIVVSVVSALVSLAWAIVSGIVSLAVLVGIVYVAYKAGSWIFGGEGDERARESLGGSRSGPESVSESPGDAAESRQDRLRRQYVDGQISEAEFERRIEAELEAEPADDIERELERER